MSMAIPVLDLQPFVRGTDREKREVARRLDDAYRRIGFVTITGHGVSVDAIRRMRDVTKAFFALPEETKRAVVSRVREGQFCGYVPFAADAAAHTYSGKDAPPDLRARYRIVKPTCQAVVDKVGPIQWPADMPEFRAAWTDYYEEMERLAERLMRLCAAALGLEDGFFAPYFAGHFSVLMATTSPVTPALPGQLRCGEHTDNGTLTMVLQSDSPGSLEVRTVEGEWIAVPPSPGAFVVNIGDLLARWTNDRWVSTVHRVGNAPASLRADAEPRQSIVFFSQPSLDAPIACLDASSAPKYPPITLREHFSRQQQKLATKDASAPAQV